MRDIHTLHRRCNQPSQLQWNYPSVRKIHRQFEQNTAAATITTPNTSWNMKSALSTGGSFWYTGRKGEEGREREFFSHFIFCFYSKHLSLRLQYPMYFAKHSVVCVCVSVCLFGHGRCRNVASLRHELWACLFWAVNATFVTVTLDHRKAYRSFLPLLACHGNYVGDNPSRL